MSLAQWRLQQIDLRQHGAMTNQTDNGDLYATNRKQSPFDTVRPFVYKTRRFLRVPSSSLSTPTFCRLTFLLRAPMSTDHLSEPTPTSRGLDSGDIVAQQANIKCLQQGIYKIAFDSTSPMSAGARAQLRNDVHGGPYAARLLRDVFSIAPELLIFHFLCTLWKSMEPALNLHWSAVLLSLVSAISRASLLSVSYCCAF